MQRRLFIRNLGLGGIGLAVTTPQIVLANTVDPMASLLAGSIYYTQANPGRWIGKEGGHVPTIERSGNSIEVTTGHEMNGYSHYIVKHIILNEKLEFFRETIFNPEKDSPVSEHDISELNNTVYAISLCNKHDAWLNVMTL